MKEASHEMTNTVRVPSYKVSEVVKLIKTQSRVRSKGEGNRDRVSASQVKTFRQLLHNNVNILTTTKLYT